jgi:hypothetical protein
MALKQTSALLNIGGSVTQDAANTFTEAEVSLPLSSLDREVFIVTDIWIDQGFPELIASKRVFLQSQVTKTSQTAATSINNPDLIGSLNESVLGGTAEFSYASSAFPANIGTSGQSRDHLAVIATPNFFINIRGSNMTGASSAECRVQGYRAKADADLYAALVTEELNA